MGRFLVLPYTSHSESAKLLAETMGGQRIKLSGSRYEHRDDDLIINWGNGEAASYLPSSAYDALLNRDVNVCINKKVFFERMQGHNIVPPFAFSRDEALRHLSFPIICRNRIEGADGQGLVIANNVEELTNARLFTQLLEHVEEYRVHMGRRFDGEIILICAQKKRAGAGHPDPRIMTGEQVFLDWIDPALLPRPVFEVTKRAMELMPELTFGGFDVICTAAWGSRVVEVNSAPMLTPMSASKYAQFFKTYAEMRDAASVVPTGSTFDTEPLLEEYIPSDEEIEAVAVDIARGIIPLRRIIDHALRHTRGE